MFLHFRKLVTDFCENLHERVSQYSLQSQVIILSCEVPYATYMPPLGVPGYGSHQRLWTTILMMLEFWYSPFLILF